jgi:predicted hydrocarbon binding protein
LKLRTGSTREQPEFSHDPSGLEMISAVTGLRVFVFGADAWRSLMLELYKSFSTGAEVILFNMGLSYGSKLASSIGDKAQGKGSSPAPRPRPDPRFFNRFATNSGWGKVELGGDVETGRNLSVTVTSCVFCEEDDFEHRCPFLRGLGKGIASTLYSRDYDVSAKCALNGERQHLREFDLKAK